MSRKEPGEWARDTQHGSSTCFYLRGKHLEVRQSTEEREIKKIEMILEGTN